jgi:DNA repair protein RecN (Recombination protein N)
MLVELHVVDLGIVADLNLVLGPGLTAITGETGAGKTLLVEAVELLVGGRADATLVRDGAAEARVEGRFVHPETGDETVLARVVPRDGRSRAYVDGRLATVGELAEAGRAVVDLHGQHAHQSLLDPSIQRAALDRYAGPPALDALGAYRAARAAVRELDAELAALGGDARARAREIDLLRYQVEEISIARLDDPGEDVALEAEELLLADAVAHREALARAYEALEGPALDALGTALAALDGRAPFATLTERLRNAQGELADIEQELRREVERVEEDPQRVEAVRARRHQLHELGRKYGSTLADVIAYGAEAATRLDELERYEERAADLDARRAARERDAAVAADALSTARHAAAAPLGRAIAAHLHELAMPHATVEIEVAPGTPTDDGHDQVTYLLAANPGEQARPLAKAASGGELSRAMLAARVVLSEAPPTLVFDEVDAGIGGVAGVAVGRLLQTLGTRHQVLCVTHLAQVAAFAGTQVVVEKAVERVGRAERTVASATVVDGDERVAELSRMLAGVGESSHARGHAAELLATAAGTASGAPLRAGPARRGRR